MMTLLAASRDQGIDSFHLSVRMRRATSRRNALTSPPVSAANDTYTQPPKLVRHITLLPCAKWQHFVKYFVSKEISQ